MIYQAQSVPTHALASPAMSTEACAVPSLDSAGY